MHKFTKVTAVAAPLDRSNVDTDAIIPKQFLKSIERTGFADNLFDEWRYLDHGEPGMDCSKRPLNKDFVLNQPEYKDAQILLTRDNFGCGSSREHAPWSLAEYGFKVIIAPSFADIFYNNCTKNGILPLILTAAEVEELFQIVYNNAAEILTVDLQQQQLQVLDKTYKFNIDSNIKARLLEGLDDIAITLQQQQAISQYEAKQKQSAPWLFQEISL